uniref:Uncharacterized protein n=1 Tax=Eptatretus burgeri TaxID=7764 RepID=A0A8C4QVK3_EPTBU
MSVASKRWLLRHFPTSLPTFLLTEMSTAPGTPFSSPARRVSRPHKEYHTPGGTPPEQNGRLGPSPLKIQEAVLLVHYTGGPAATAGYSRRLSLSILIEVEPSVVFTNLSAVPATSAQRCHLVIDVQNQMEHEVQLQSKHNDDLLLRPHESKRFGDELVSACVGKPLAVTIRLTNGTAVPVGPFSLELRPFLDFHNGLQDWALKSVPHSLMLYLPPQVQPAGVVTFHCSCLFLFSGDFLLKIQFQDGTEGQFPASWLCLPTVHVRVSEQPV